MKKKLLFLGILAILIGCKVDSPSLTKVDGSLLPIDKTLRSDSEIEDFIAPYREELAVEMNKILSYTPIDLQRTDGRLESSLGNLMADLCYQRAHPVFLNKTGKRIDFALFNYGGIRAGIGRGDIRVEHAFKLMPFENSLVVVEMTGAKLQELIAFLAEGKVAHPLSKQITLMLTDTGTKCRIGGQMLDQNKHYYVLTSDYLQRGGDHMNFFADPVNLFSLNYKVRDAILDYFTATDTIRVELDGRFRKVLPK